MACFLGHPHCKKVLLESNGNRLSGYARVSTNGQETATQVAALKAAGCERTYREKASGGRWGRPEAGAGFRSLTEAIDTTTPTGRMMTQVVEAVR
jgi:DNA invertase Pin-like site-specific DNA recombinase